MHLCNININFFYCFRYLDADSLLSTASVNKTFNSICKGDIILRQRIRRRLREQRKARIQAFLHPARTIEVTRTFTATTTTRVAPFGSRNGNVTVKMLPRVEYERPKEKKRSCNTIKLFKNSVQPFPKNIVNKKRNKVLESAKTTKNIRL